MIDPKVLRENPNSVKELLFKRNMEYPLDELLKLDKKRRHLITELQIANHNKNLIAREIAAKRKSNQETTNQIQEMSHIGEKIKALEKENRENEEKYKKLLHSVPNFFHESVPIGKDENSNKIIKIFNKNELLENLDIGYHDKKSIQETPDKTHTSQIKNHVQISNELDLLDLERELEK